MATIRQVAQAFVAGREAKCHNAKTNGQDYILHGNTIASRQPDGSIEFDWCGWYGPTTANHMNHILAELGKPRVSYAQARDTGASWFIEHVWEPEL